MSKTYRYTYPAYGNGKCAQFQALISPESMTISDAQYKRLQGELGTVPDFGPYDAVKVGARWELR